MAEVASAHAPSVAGADPGLLGFESWRGPSNPRDRTKIGPTPEYAAWRALRESEDGKWIGLARSCGAKSNPVEESAFEVGTGHAESERFTWIDAVRGMVANTDRSLQEYGCSRIPGVGSGGAVAGPPAHAVAVDWFHAFGGIVRRVA